MFANNCKISGRQAFRLLTFDLLGIGTLLLPTMLAKVAGRDGIFSILLGVVAALFYVKLLEPLVLEMKEEFPFYLEKKLGKVGSKIVLGGYTLYFILLAGYTAYLFSDVVLKSLLQEESFVLVLVLALLLSAYGAWGGIEGRARVYELLFWFLLVPLFAMLFFAMDEVEWDYLMPVFMERGSGIWIGGYCMFLTLALLSLLLFLGGSVGKKRQLIRAGQMAALFTGVIHAVLYLILVGIFGVVALSKMEFPAITMMSTVKTYGGFLKRTDAFMFGIWFFTLYALLNGATFYGGYSLAHLLGLAHGEKAKKRERIASVCLLVVVFGLALFFYRSKAALYWYELFLWYVGTPFLVLVPFLLRMVRMGRKNTKARRMAAIVVLVCLFGTCMSGCRTAELEERNFPVELAVGENEHISKAWLAAEYKDNCKKDYSHLKVLFLEENLLENEQQMNELLELLEQKNDVPRNTYVVATKDAKKLFELEESLGQSVGEYLEQQFETVSQIDKLAYPTLGMLYEEQENRMETLFFPFVDVEEEKPAVESFYVWKRGGAAGRVEKNEAMLSFFTQNNLESYLLSVGNETIVELSEPCNEITFEETDTKKIVVKIHCKGLVVNQTKQLSEEQLADSVRAYMNETARGLLLEREIDLSNSYRKLGGAKREWYRTYLAAPETFESSMQITYDVQIKWLDF